jgi:ubiquinone/menaquinone biosynthesis C-methylase UbiE
MQTDQELFAEGLATYQKVVSENLMSHREVYGTLSDVLVKEAPRQFVFLDIACGAATASAGALVGTDIGRYIGIDISRPSLAVAEEALKVLTCPVELRCQDFVEAIDQWSEPVDVIWIGMSLHHLLADEKLATMRRIGEILHRDGLFLIWEPTRLEGEDRAGWMNRFSSLRSSWSAVSDDQFAAFDTHNRASDFPETAADWASLGRSAGFTRADELYTMANRMGRVYRYRH